jgi:Mg-chelatase subunit ChlD
VNIRFTAALVLAAGPVIPALAQETKPEVAAIKLAQPVAERPTIEVVFVLDTTGSMGGLIDGAKRKIWSIANQMASAKPAPRIRIGLVGYRDRGDAYITTLTSMTDDLDKVYSDLMGFSAGGGGDGPESVNQALNEAVTKFDWSKDRSTLRLIYLVGDAPPHMDYEQDVKYAESCKLAATAGITINSIQCGNDVTTTPIWQEIARKAEGEYFAIQQDGGMTAIATPFDEELGRLGAELERTVVAYGSVAEQRVQNEKMAAADTLTAAAAPAESRAERAVYKASPAGGMALCGANDLVQACMDKQVELSKMEKDQLNDEMKAMTPEQRAAFIEQKIKDRKACQAKISEVNVKRQEFIKEKLAETGGKDSFDALVLAALKKQGARCGFSFDAEKK